VLHKVHSQAVVEVQELQVHLEITKVDVMEMQVVFLQLKDILDLQDKIQT
jgi:hypothetical protein